MSRLRGSLVTFAIAKAGIKGGRMGLTGERVHIRESLKIILVAFVRFIARIEKKADGVTSHEGPAKCPDSKASSSGLEADPGEVKHSQDGNRR